MCVQSQIQTDPDLEGYFESPHDDPPQWLCMLTLYVDESNESDHGRWIAAGYLGDKPQWQDYVCRWRDAIKPSKTLHLASLRLGAPSAVRRWKNRLERIGLVPKECGLKAFVGSVCERDHKSEIQGTALEPLMNGYTMSVMALIEIVLATIPRGERLEIVFEEQLSYAAQRERAVNFISKQRHNRGRRNRPILAKCGTTPKSILTEASDYLAYAKLQEQIDPASQKASLSSPILKADTVLMNHKNYVADGILDDVRRERARRGKQLNQRTEHEKKRLRKYVQTGELS